MLSLRRRAPLALAAVLVGSGGVHLVRPQSFAAIMPRAIPREHHTTLIYVSGLAELACAAGLIRRTRWAAAASRAVAWGRLPLQLVMAWAALQTRPDPP
ncbi:MAG: DoxX family protein [Acidimicrobiales bacterium]